MHAGRQLSLQLSSVMQGDSSPLRRQAAGALQALRDGAEQIGLDPSTLRKQVR